MANRYDTLKLEKGMYQEAGSTFTQVLERLDPSEQYKGTSLEGLDAFQRQLKRFDIKVKGAGCDAVEKFFRTSDAAVLFPEYIARSVRQGMDESNLIPSITAATTNFDGMDYRSIAAKAGGKRDFDQEAHHAVARQAAAQTAVLLKNENDLLPLAPNTRVAVIGDMALEPRYQGAGSSLVNPTRLDKPLDCLKASGLDVVGHAQGYLRNGKDDTGLQQAAVQLAAQADVVLLYLGLPEIFESEGMDRSHMRLPANQNRLLEAVAAANPKVVVVLSGGSPVELPWYDKAAAIVHGYLGGQAGAGAMADILTGKVNPSGKLAETYPLVYDDTPNRDFFPGRELTAQYRESIFVGYRYYLTAQKAVRFPFGFGLSYTTFAYSDLKADKEKVTFTLTNTGKRAGAEVAQLYVSRFNSQLFTPLRELKGFAKVFLQPGESRTVTIPLDDKAFRYFNVKTNRWEIEGGEYRLEVGASAADILLTASVEVEGTGAPIPYDREKLSCYYSAQVQAVPDDQFETLLGRPIPQDKWDRSQPLGYNDSLSQMIYAKGFVARFAAGRLAAIQRKSEEKDQPNLNVLFIHSMPFRGLAKMSNGLVTTEMTASILEACNGHFFRGMGKTIAGFFANGKVKKERSKKL